MSEVKKILKKLFLFKEPEKVEKFILKENPDEADPDIKNNKKLNKSSDKEEGDQSVGQDKKNNGEEQSGQDQKDNEEGNKSGGQNQKDKEDGYKSGGQNPKDNKDGDQSRGQGQQNDIEEKQSGDQEKQNGRKENHSNQGQQDEEEVKEEDSEDEGKEREYFNQEKTHSKKEKSRRKGIQVLNLDGDQNNKDRGHKTKKSKAVGEDILKREYLSLRLEDNLDYIKKKYTIPDNGDVVLREFDIVVKNKTIAAFIVFFDGMVDRSVIDMALLQPLMVLSNLDIKGSDQDIGNFIKNHLLTHNQLKVTKSYSQIIDEVNFGGVGLFVDGLETGFAFDVKGWEHRTVGRPNTELVIRGPQEGFTEGLRANTALIRKILKDEDLVAESIVVGRRSKTPCSLMYIKDIANDSLVGEVKRRLKGIKVDYIIDSGELEQLLEDNSFLAVPQIMATERPDRVASMLTDGRVAVVVHGSPFVLVMPATSTDLIHAAEDSYIRFPYANLLRLVRYSAIVMALLLPGLYVAITNYHHEMIPTDLLFAIEASREKVPFPSVVEILMMEFAFELIREAGIRIPGPIGPTLGIIGALILGQAAVAANIVSPILIIVVAVTGIGSFAMPNFSLGFGFRILRFAFIILGAMAGFLGITFGLFVLGMWVAGSKSFGVPFLVPFGPKTKSKFGDHLLKSPIWKQNKRADYLNVKDDEKQPEISRKWWEDDRKRPH